MNPICRVCMTSSGVLVDIFTKGRESFPSLEHMLNECVDVKIKRNDKFPKQICKICISDVHAAFRFKRNYELSVKQLNEKLDIKENKRLNTTDLSNQENNFENSQIKCEPKKQNVSKRKRALASTKTPLKVLTVKATNKKPRKQENVTKENVNEEHHKEESKNEAKPESTTVISDCANNQQENERKYLPLSETPSVSEEDPKTKNENISKNLTAKSGNVYVCEKCDKVYKWKSLWLQHAAAHTGERPYHCEHCSRSYAYKSHLKRHEKIHFVDRKSL